MKKEEKKCRACNSFQCVGHFQMREVVYNDFGVYRPASSYVSLSGLATLAVVK